MNTESKIADATVAERNKIVRRAALEFSTTGSIAELAKRVEVPYRTLSSALKTGKFSPTLALKLEKVCGYRLIKKETLCPDVFK